MKPEQVTLNNRYKLLELAGTGGMASVYRAQDLVLGRLVAVKVLQSSLTDSPEFLRRFQREAHTVANLSHPNIVTVHDIGQDGPRYYIVMELIEGQTLKKLLRGHIQRHQRAMGIDQALDLTIQICAGIGYAHRAGLVHSDVKPQNVLVRPDGRVKVADFGIARALSQTLQERDLGWGTPQYLSPEQSSGEPATPASDVYAIGLILFELLAGRLPFTADSPAEMAIKHARVLPPPVSYYNPSVPKQLEDVIGKVLSKEPGGRYRTAGQFGRVLTAYQESSRQATGYFPAEREPALPPPAATPVEPERLLPAPRRGTVAISRPEATPPALLAPAERKTEFYPPERARPGDRLPRPLEPASFPAEPPPLHWPVSDVAEVTDWVAILLAVVALIALLGLIPLWYLAYRAWLPLG
jgi:serine/threonine-protein kinase